MVIINPVSAALGIGQLGMGIAGAFGEQQKHKQQVYQSAFSNFMSRHKTEMMNQYRQQAYQTQLNFAKQQFQFNAEAADRAYITEQARFNEQVAQFAFNKLNMQQELANEQGKVAASEQYGRSAQRLAQVEVLGQFGRNQSILAESLASAARQSMRNMEQVGREHKSADLQVYGSVMNPPMMEIAEPLYQPGAGPNMALSIGGAALGATSSFFAGSKTYSNNDLVPFM